MKMIIHNRRTPVVRSTKNYPIYNTKPRVRRGAKNNEVGKNFNNYQVGMSEKEKRRNYYNSRKGNKIEDRNTIVKDKKIFKIQRYNRKDNEEKMKPLKERIDKRLKERPNDGGEAIETGQQMRYLIYGPNNKDDDRLKLKTSSTEELKDYIMNDLDDKNQYKFEDKGNYYDVDSKFKKKEIEEYDDGLEWGIETKEMKEEKKKNIKPNNNANNINTSLLSQETKLALKNNNTGKKAEMKKVKAKNNIYDDPNFNSLFDIQSEVRVSKDKILKKIQMDTEPNEYDMKDIDDNHIKTNISIYRNPDIINAEIEDDIELIKDVKYLVDKNSKYGTDNIRNLKISEAKNKHINDMIARIEENREKTNDIKINEKTIIKPKPKRKDSIERMVGISNQIKLDRDIKTKKTLTKQPLILLNKIDTFKDNASEKLYNYKTRVLEDLKNNRAAIEDEIKMFEQKSYFIDDNEKEMLNKLEDKLEEDANKVIPSAKEIILNEEKIIEAENKGTTFRPGVKVWDRVDGPLGKKYVKITPFKDKSFEDNITFDLKPKYKLIEKKVNTRNKNELGLDGFTGKRVNSSGYNKEYFVN